jgi:hypothetical protein
MTNIKKRKNDAKGSVPIAMGDIIDRSSKMPGKFPLN